MEQLSIPRSPARLAFLHYLRTGERVPEAAFSASPVETKFNPYHDPRNGQFTFAPGGGGPGGDFSIARQPRQSSLSDGVYRPGADRAALIRVGTGPRPPRGIGGNIGSFYDPMTLEQVFPTLARAPAGAVLAAADSILGFTGPANEMLASINLDSRNALVSEIKLYDPKYHHARLDGPTASQRRRARSMIFVGIVQRRYSGWQATTGPYRCRRIGSCKPKLTPHMIRRSLQRSWDGSGQVRRNGQPSVISSIGTYETLFENFLT